MQGIPPNYLSKMMAVKSRLDAHQQSGLTNKTALLIFGCLFINF